MTGPGQVGRQLRARYAFAGASAELERTLPLEDGEVVLFHGAVRLRGTGPLPRPAVLRLTPRRLAVLAHRAFGADRVWDLPRGAVLDVQARDGVVQLSWLSDSGPSVLSVAGWRGRTAPDIPQRDIRAIVDRLRAWLGGPGEGGRPTDLSTRP